MNLAELEIQINIFTYIFIHLNKIVSLFIYAPCIGRALYAVYLIIQIYKEYPSICQYKHLAAAVGLTDRYLRPIPC